MTRGIKTDTKEFARFHDCLTKSAPKGYIPHYLQLTNNDKDPVRGFGWKEKPLVFDSALELMKKGANIGICASEKDVLVIVDVDDKTLVDTTTVPETLITISRKRVGEHRFYFEDKPEEIVNIPCDKAGEIRANNQYVVAPGSYVPVNDVELKKIQKEDRVNAGKYTIKVARSPNKISFIQLPKVFLKQFYEDKQLEQDRHVPDFDPKLIDDSKISPLYKLTFKDILPNTPVDTRVPHPLHESETGANFSVSGNGKIAHCWRHNVSLTVPQFLSVKAKLLKCKGAGNSHKGAGSGSSLLTGNDELIKKVWDYAVKEGYVKETDKKPSPHKIEEGGMKRPLTKQGYVVGRGKLPNIKWLSCIKKTIEEGIHNEEEAEDVFGVVISFLKDKRVPIKDIEPLILECNAKTKPPFRYGELLRKIGDTNKDKYPFGCEELKNYTTFNTNCDLKNCNAKVKVGVSDNILGEITKIEEIIPKVPDEEAYKYHLTVRKKRIVLTSGEILSPVVFRRKYLERFHVRLNISPVEWGEILDDLLLRVETSKEFILDEDVYILDEFISQLVQCQITDDREKAITNHEFLLLHEGKLLYYNKFIKDFLDSSKTKINLTRFGQIFKKYYTPPTIKIAIGKATPRFWILKHGILGIDPTLEGENDD